VDGYTTPATTPTEEGDAAPLSLFRSAEKRSGFHRICNRPRTESFLASHCAAPDPGSRRLTEESSCRAQGKCFAARGGVQKASAVLPLSRRDVSPSTIFAGSLSLTGRRARPEFQHLLVGFAEVQRARAGPVLHPLRIVELPARTDTRAPRPAEVPLAMTVFAEVALKAERLGCFPHLRVNRSHATILPDLEGEE